MSRLVLDASGVIAEMAAKLQAAADVHPAVAFDGRVALPLWLAESARAQADRVFLALDDTPVEHRDLRWAEHFIETSGLAFLEAWGWIMTAFGTGAKTWAKDAADAAAKAYNDRLDELAPGIHAGGHA